MRRSSCTFDRETEPAPPPRFGSIDTERRVLDSAVRIFLTSADPTDPDVIIGVTTAWSPQREHREAPARTEPAAFAPLTDLSSTGEGLAVTPNIAESPEPRPMGLPARVLGSAAWVVLGGITAFALVACALAVRAEVPATTAFVRAPAGVVAPARLADPSPAPALPVVQPVPPAIELRDRSAKPLLGRLALRRPARATAVFLDGKRLLGSGPRTFDVYCGPHTIAIGHKSDAREVVVPCKGELVVTAGMGGDNASD